MKRFAGFGPLGLVVSAILIAVLPSAHVSAGVGDPQVRTDHPWYPGELACSTFDRLFATQAELYERVTGERVETDEQRALAAWLWRNTHYWHGEEGVQDLWGKGFGDGGDLRTREYWTGLFSHGFGLCGTTHSQWTVELQQLFGHCRARGVGVNGHNALEVYLTGGPYQSGRWALLDHDLSCVVFDESGKKLCSVDEIRAQLDKLIDRKFKPERQHGWLISGLHPDDAKAYSRFQVAEYLPGYAGPPPMVHLRRGETLRRYLRPGLEDGKTFVYWGRNYRIKGIPGPERSLTWVNQPEKMYRSEKGAPYAPGIARYANAVFTYTPNFADGTYEEGIVAEDAGSVTFSFQSPYIIAATPAGDGDWDIYKPGCKNGLIVRATGLKQVEVSVDGGATWTKADLSSGSADLTDTVKGHKQYLLRVTGSRDLLKQSGLTIRTVCQANSSTIPRLTDGSSRVTFAASNQGVLSAGPTVPHATKHVSGGGFGTRQVSLQLTPPKQHGVHHIYAAAHVASGNPPRTEVKYHIGYRIGDMPELHPIVSDWSIEPPGDQPKDFWSQSFCYGDKQLASPVQAPITVQFGNSGGRNYLRAEAHLVYEVPPTDGTRVTFHWTDSEGSHTESLDFAPGGRIQTADLKTGKNVETHWVEYSPIAR